MVEHWQAQETEAEIRVIAIECPADFSEGGRVVQLMGENNSLSSVLPAHATKLTQTSCNAKR